MGKLWLRRAKDITRAVHEGATQREQDIITLLENSSLDCCPLDNATCPRNMVTYDNIQLIKNHNIWKEDK